ncbi:MAG: hypothetical protein HFG26_12620 [Provencibacterium sp.]|nr:hypothetical protein [Provencibacterium sp.]
MTHSQKLWWRRPLRVLQTNLQVRDTPQMVPEEIAAQTEAISANLLVVNFGGIYAWYDSKVPFHHVNEFLPKDFDLMAEILRACHARGIRVAARFDFSKADDRAFQCHPEWFVRCGNGEPKSYGQGRPGDWSRLMTTCLSAGYRNEELAVPVLKEVLARYDIDGIFFNAPHYEFCSCPLCRERYRQRLGEEMPEFPEHTPATPGLPAGLHPEWPAIVFQENMALLYKTVKDCAPELPVILYYNGYSSDHLAERAAISDLLCTEAQDILSKGRGDIPETWRPAISMRMGRSLPDAPVPFGIIHSCPGMDWRHTGLPTAEYEFWMSGIPANGGSIWHSVTGFERTISDKRIYRSIGKINRLTAKAEPYMEDAQSAAEAALLWDGPASGWAEGLLACHLPFDLCCPGQLTPEKLARYRLVILPEQFRPDEAASQVLEQYVRGGGRLLAECQSLHPVLAGVLGVERVLHRSGYLAASYLRVEDFDALGFAETPLLPHRGETLYCKPSADARMLLTLVPPFSPLDGVGSPPERASILCPQTDIPLALLHDYGEGGRSVFLPFRLGHLIETFGLPEHIELLKKLAWLLLDHAPFFELDAPSGVQATLFQKDGQYLVHLINGVGKRPLQENLPLSDLCFRLRAPIRSVQSLLEDTSIEVIPHPDGSTAVRLKELRLWNALLVNCQEEGTL